MTEIPYDEETTRDWDWFAVDDEGNIAHLATGTFRRLPESVRCDWERAEELIAYFEAAPEIGDFAVRAEFWESEKTQGNPTILKNEAERQRYFRSFAKMAKRGLYSYDTVLKTPGDYYGVTVPQSPLNIRMLPQEVRERLAKTTASVRFRETAQIPEFVTLKW